MCLFADKGETLEEEKNCEKQNSPNLPTAKNQKR
jgi:hypothetical protein